MMMPIFFLYMLKVTVCSGILFGYYWFFLRNKPFHVFNRFCLLGIIILSLCLPLIKIQLFQPATTASPAVIQLLQAIPGDHSFDDTITVMQSNNRGSWQWSSLFYALISLLLLLLFARSVFIVYKLIKSSPAKNEEEAILINTSAKGTPFSFLHFIFWNTAVDINSGTGRQMLAHEMVHVQQKHSYDKIFVSIVTAIFWCNPFFWLIKKELGMVHEFIADNRSVDNNDTGAFAAMILQAAYPQQNFNLTNSFFHPPIKRRLTMITKNNNRMGYFSRIALLPLLLAVFAGFSFKSPNNKLLYTGEKTIVMIDAGHGGHDFGAKASNGVLEKDITLALAKKIKELNKNSNIDITLSRNEDTYFTPQQRVEFAKTSKAHLFISLHVDAEEKNENKTGIHLFTPLNINAAYKQSQLLGSSIAEALQQDNSIPVASEMQQLNQGAWVLKANPCPAVLVETGYITNPADLAYISSINGQEAIAQNILNGIEKYLTAPTHQ